MLTRTVVLVVSAVLLLGSCSSGGEDSAPSTSAAPNVDLEAILADLADDVVIPSYASLAEATDGLAVASDALCAEPSSTSLDDARGAWRDAVVAWQRTRAMGVGPAMERRLMSDVGFEARPTRIEELLAGTDPVDAASLAEEGAALRGLYALEVLLFGEGSESLAGPEGARRCAYAAGASTLVAEATAVVAADWTEGDARDAFVGGADGDPRTTLAALLNEVSRRLEELDAVGLRDLAAADGLEDLDDDRSDGPAAFRLADRSALLDGVAAVLGDGGSGISAVVVGSDPDAADRLVAATDGAVAAMGELPESVADAFDDLDAVAAASDAVAELKVLASTEIATELGVTITFSDSDGDA